MDPLCSKSLCSISPLEELVRSVSFFGRVNKALKRTHCYLRLESRVAQLDPRCRRWEIVELPLTPRVPLGSRRAVAVDQYSCTSVWRATPHPVGRGKRLLCLAHRWQATQVEDVARAIDEALMKYAF